MTARRLYLSVCERRALLLHAEGLNYQQIADRLGRSRCTIRHQLDGARIRWGAGHLGHLLVMAVRAGEVLIRPLTDDTNAEADPIG